MYGTCKSKRQLCHSSKACANQQGEGTNVTSIDVRVIELYVQAKERLQFQETYQIPHVTTIN
jgi:hypothetical protein